MNNQTNIERIVMRRVRAIRVLRMVFSSATASCLILFAALYGIGREVWVAQVFANAPTDAIGHARYMLYALEHTRLTVQVLTLLTATSLVYLARETARLTTTVFTRGYA